MFKVIRKENCKHFPVYKRIPYCIRYRVAAVSDTSHLCVHVFMSPTALLANLFTFLVLLSPEAIYRPSLPVARIPLWFFSEIAYSRCVFLLNYHCLYEVGCVGLTLTSSFYYEPLRLATTLVITDG